MQPVFVPVFIRPPAHDYRTRDVVLYNSMARPMKLTLCVFNKVFLVNHWRDILCCNYKWLCLVTFIDA